MSLEYNFVVELTNLIHILGTTNQIFFLIKQKKNRILIAIKI